MIPLLFPGGTSSKVKVKWVQVAQLYPTLCDPMDCPWNSPGQNTGVGSFSLLQGIFPTQGSNPGLPHCRRILYQLSHKGSPVVKNPPMNAGNIGDAGDWSLIPGLGRSPGVGNGSLLQYSCLGKPMDRGAWRATVHWARVGCVWVFILHYIGEKMFTKKKAWEGQ